MSFTMTRVFAETCASCVRPKKRISTPRDDATSSKRFTSYGRHPRETPRAPDAHPIVIDAHDLHDRTQTSRIEVEMVLFTVEL